MHTVVETPEFLAQAKKLLTESERMQLVDTVSQYPDTGDVIKGTGGFRKLRLARKGSGKSGGYRVIYFFYDQAMPIYLFSIYAKSGKENISEKQRNAFHNIAQAMKQANKKS